MPHILGIGIATLDIINTVDGYPAEDAEVRAVSQQLCRGGNCTNTLVVLSQLGHQCTWGGVLTTEPNSQYIHDNLVHNSIDLGNVQILDHGKIPTSYITLNQRSGSRTIVHYRDLREFDYQDFKRIDLRAFNWLHFEGRNVPETLRMLRYAKDIVAATPCSVEIEKPRQDIEQLFAYADVLMFSRHYALSQGYEEPQDFMNAIIEPTRQRIRFLSWGEAGAFALDNSDHLFHSPAYPPPRVVSTLGAGDTFNAGIIDALLRGVTIDDALRRACQLAGRKCGREGFDDISLLT